MLYGALRGERAYNLVTEISVALLGIVFLIVVWKSRPMGITFYGAFADDPFTRFMSGLALIGSLVTLLLSLEFMRSERIAGFEFPVLILLSTLGMLMLIAANDFIALYLGLELMSLALYVIAAYRRHDLRATEAGLKYFVLGALSSGMLLYGASLIYGYSGSVTFSDVAAAVLIEEHDWFSHGILYKLGVDGVSMPFVLLTTFLMPISIAASWGIENRVKAYMIAFLALETLMIGVFVALDLVLFYLFFEGGLIPMFLIIGIWGHGNRVYAAFKFFLYTFAGSVLMLLAIMAMYWTAGTTDITVLLKTAFDPQD